MSPDPELTRIWRSYHEHGTAGLRAAAPRSAHGCLYAALLACAGGDGELACDHAACAAGMAPASALSAALCRYLARGEGETAIYASGEAFVAFTRAGGNPELYTGLARLLRRAYREHAAPVRLVDIGVGEGMALLEALDECLGHIDLIEPSAERLSRAHAQVLARGISCAMHGATVEAFIDSAESAAPGRWHVAQATFSLQCLAPARSAGCLSWLRQRCDHLLIAEFDVPAFEPGPGQPAGSGQEQPPGPMRAGYLLQRYERGVGLYSQARAQERRLKSPAEEQPEGALVVQGFLLPILVSAFTGGGSQNFEQPIAAWQRACVEAGFQNVRAELVHPYWWADAYLISAR